jgi:hypothetical protein
MCVDKDGHEIDLTPGHITKVSREVTPGDVPTVVVTFVARLIEHAPPAETDGA